MHKYIPLFFIAVLFLLIIPSDFVSAARPTVTSFSPADNTVGGFSRADNLVIIFNESVTKNATSSTFVTIKKTSDDSTFEAVDVSGSQVTGSGSAVITINPTSNLAIGTAYYVQVDLGAFYNGTNEYYAGISDTSTWNFTASSITSSSNNTSGVASTPTIDVSTNATTATVIASYPGGGSGDVDELGFTYEGDGEKETVSFSHGLNNLKYVVRDLVCGEEYTFEAYVKNSAGTSTSSEVDVTIDDCVAEEMGESEMVDETPSATEPTEAPAETSSAIPSATAQTLLSSAPSDLTIGSESAAVVSLQNFLITENTGAAAQYLATVGATGYFGSITQAALAEYQAANGIAPALGYYGPITRTYIGNLTN